MRALARALASGSANARGAIAATTATTSKRLRMGPPGLDVVADTTVMPWLSRAHEPAERVRHDFAASETRGVGARHALARDHASIESIVCSLVRGRLRRDWNR